LDDAIVSDGSDVLLFLSRARTYLVRAKAGEKFHTHKGFIDFDQVVGKRHGDVIHSSMGVPFALFKPTPYDYVRKALRATQIIYPKDVALIVAYSGIGPGSRVVEAGTGSGALTSALASSVQPNGRVYSYEVRKEFFARAAKNLARAGVDEYVVLRNADISQGISERGVDAVVLDLATPWLIVKEAHNALKGGGRLVAFSPTIEQVVKTVGAMDAGFVDVETIECFLRRMKVKAGSTRPEGVMRGHTGYISYGRKIFR
jgi:tRNA (adenine57-N1/adenine58-N1)-methyltransferase